MEQDKIQDLTYDLYTDGSRAWKAVDDLVTIGKPAVPHLIKVLKKKSDEGARVRASRALGKIGDPSAIKALAKNLNDESINVGIETLRALVAIGKPAVPHLIKALKLRNNDRRFSVVSALGKIGDPSAIKALSIVAAKDKSWKVRKEAGDAIKQLSAD